MTTLEIENKIENRVDIETLSQLDNNLTNNSFYEKDVNIKDDAESFSATLQKAIDFSTNTHQNSAEDAEVNDKQFYYSSGTNHFLLEKSIKAETIKNMPVNQVPFTPKWFMGIVNIRGVIMPVININDLVNSQTNSNSQDVSESEESQQGGSYLLKLEHQNHTPIVFKVDSLPRQINMKNVVNKTKVINKPDWMVNTLETTKESGKNAIIEIDHHRLLSLIKELS